MNVYDEALGRLTEMIRDEMGESPEPGEHTIRCKPGAIPLRLPASVRRAPAKLPVEGAEVERSKASDTRDTDESVFVVRGTASSTSVDWYGTEMSARALDDMAMQFNRGVDLFPRHGGFLDTVEWDEVVGRTFSGVLREADVVEPADVSERGFVLDIDARVNRSAPRAEELKRRLDSGQEIGLSIGGWFLEVRYVTDDEGEISRIIVERVLLDHVAIVRSPANPDSVGLQILRDAGRAAKAIRTAAPEGLQARHVIRVDEEDDAIVIRLAKSERAPSADEEDDAESEERSVEAGNPGEVPSREGADVSYHPGEDFARSENQLPGDDPEPRSDAMSAEQNEMLDLLRSIKAGQDDLTARVDELEARTTEAPEPTPVTETRDAIATLGPEAQADLIARAIAKALDERAPKAPESTPEPSEDPSVAELRAKVAALESERDNRDAALANLIGSGRVGRGSTMQHPVLGGGHDSEQAERDVNALVERCKQNGDVAPVLCAVVNRHKSAIAISREPSGHLPRGDRGKQYLQAAHNAPSTLRSLLIAAERDGIIGDLDAGWRR